MNFGTGGEYNLTIYARVFKRLIDIVVALVGLIVFAPVFLAIGIAIRLDSPGPVLFKQRRIGKNKREFMILKFRTMRTDTPQDIPTHLLANPDAHITKVGSFLRKSSLDELPQILNIFKGDMSVVGPRPALWNQDDLIAERDKYGANNVLPGLTGLAQISGRDELEIPVKAKLDGEYVAKMGLWLDVKIFFATIISVVRRDGIKEGKSENTGADSTAISGDERVKL